MPSTLPPTTSAHATVPHVGPAVQSTDRIVTGILLLVAFCITAPLIDVAAKLAGRTVPVGTITLLRFVVQAALMGPLVVVMRLSLRVSPRAMWLLIARAATTILATFGFVAALKVMAIADALAITFVEPFILLLIGKYLLGEEVGKRRVIASLVGFTGALLVIQPAFVTFGLYALFPLMCALFFALYMLITRELSREVHPVSMQFLTALFAAILCVPMLMIGGRFNVESVSFVWPEGIALLWCVLVGVAGTTAHMFMTYALRFAPSSTLAPVQYLEMVTAALFGYLVFGNFPNALTWVGIGIIIGSGLYIIHRERMVERAAQAHDLTGPR